MVETKTLGDYTIIKQIGQGPLGTVFLAEHRFMKKQYVLKVLPEEFSCDRAFIQRFEEEVAKLSTLDHPNIVKLHNISYANGLYFLVSDCVVDEMGETTNLAQYIISKGKRLGESELYRLLEQIADALDYAHNKKFGDKGIAHCGIKLNNILVSKAGSGIQFVLSDFGLTRIIGPGAVLSKTYSVVAEALEIGSSVNKSLGELQKYPVPAIPEERLSPLHASFLQTFAFLAPEQKRANHPFSTHAKVDVYAFGILAYYLMNGQFPEGYFNMPSKALSDFIWNWDGLIMNCLQCDPEKRVAHLLPTLRSVKETVIAAAPTMTVDMSAPKKVAEPVVVHPAAEVFFIKPPEQELQTAAVENQQNPQVVAETEEIVQPQRPQSHYFCPQPQMNSVPPSSVAEPTIDQPLRPVLSDAQLERPVTDMDPAAIFNVDSSVTQYVPEKKEIKEVKPLLSDMVVVNGGTFLMGSTDGNRDEMPRHHVNIDSYAIDVHPVTNEQFVRFLEALGGEKDSNHQDVIRLKDSRIKRSGGKTSIESGYAKHPVVGVTWYGAAAYAKWIGKRLPSEAEWENACKGGNEEALFPTGDDIEKSQANFFSSDTTPVMSYAPNAYGLYDMAGNVYEWCSDWYGYNYYEVSVQEPDNPKGPLQGNYRVLRGGCWKSLKEDLRCSRRHRNNPGTVNGTYGFRCAANVQ